MIFPSAQYPLGDPTRQMQRRRLSAALRLQRAVRRHFQCLRLRRRQAAAEASLENSGGFEGNAWEVNYRENIGENMGI